MRGERTEEEGQKEEEDEDKVKEEGVEEEEKVAKDWVYKACRRKV